MNVPPGGTIIRAILSVYVGALYGTVVHIGNTHVGPVNVSGLNIHYNAIWVSAPRYDYLPVGTV